MAQVTISEVLDRVKRRLNITFDRDLADMIGVSKQEVSNWRARDSRKGLADFLIAISGYVDVHWALSEKDSPIIKKLEAEKSEGERERNESAARLKLLTADMVRLREQLEAAMGWRDRALQSEAQTKHLERQLQEERSRNEHAGPSEEELLQRATDRFIEAQRKVLSDELRKSQSGRHLRDASDAHDAPVRSEDDQNAQ